MCGGGEVGAGDREGSQVGGEGVVGRSPHTSFQGDGSPSLRKLRGGTQWLTSAWYLKTQ